MAGDEASARRLLGFTSRLSLLVAFVSFYRPTPLQPTALQSYRVTEMPAETPKHLSSPLPNAGGAKQHWSLDVAFPGESDAAACCALAFAALLQQSTTRLSSELNGAISRNSVRHGVHREQDGLARRWRRKFAHRCQESLGTF